MPPGGVVDGGARKARHETPRSTLSTIGNLTRPASRTPCTLPQCSDHAGEYVGRGAGGRF